MWCTNHATKVMSSDSKIFNLYVAVMIKQYVWYHCHATCSTKYIVFSKCQFVSWRHALAGFDGRVSLALFRFTDCWFWFGYSLYLQFKYQAMVNCWYMYRYMVTSRAPCCYKNFSRERLGESSIWKKLNFTGKRNHGSVVLILPMRLCLCTMSSFIHWNLHLCYIIVHPQFCLSRQTIAIFLYCVVGLLKIYNFCQHW